MRFLTIFLSFIIMAAGSIAAERPQIKASDVVFMYTPSDPAQYDAYQGTVAGWGGRAQSKSNDQVKVYEQRVNEAVKRGIRFCGSVDTIVDFGGYIDMAPDTFMNAVCRDLDGKPLQVPWLWDMKHKGQPAYWFCINNPDYMNYLRDQAERASLAPVDGVHIDDYGATSNCADYNHGCFCESCIKGFREYLKKNLSNDQLKMKGIDDIGKFDYKAFLQEEGIRAIEFSSNNKRIPLSKEFRDYQNGQMKAYIQGIYEYAEQLRSKPLLRSVNSSASSPRTLLPASIIDYFCGEIDHHAMSKSVSSEPVFVYRLVEAVGKRQTATASGQDWAWIKVNEKPGFVRTWIAQAYSYGSVFMVPHNQWCFTQELGTHWWKGKPEDFTFLYRFVRSNAALLDDYTSLASIAVLFTDADFDMMKAAVSDLTRHNIPYVIIYNAEPEDAKALTASVLGYQTLLTGKDWGVKTIGNTQAVIWKGLSSLPASVTGEVKVDGAEKILVSLRENKLKPEAPIVCHLLNQNYNIDKDQVDSVTCTIRIKKSLLKEKGAELVLHQPKKEDQPLDPVSEGDYLSMNVPDLGLWGIVEMR